MNTERKMNNVHRKLECTAVADGGGTDPFRCEKLLQKTSLEHIESVHKSTPSHPRPNLPPLSVCDVCVDADVAVMTPSPRQNKRACVTERRTTHAGPR